MKSRQRCNARKHVDAICTTYRAHFIVTHTHTRGYWATVRRALKGGEHQRAVVHRTLLRIPPDLFTTLSHSSSSSNIAADVRVTKTLRPCVYIYIYKIKSSFSIRHRVFNRITVVVARINKLFLCRDVAAAAAILTYWICFFFLLVIN